MVPIKFSIEKKMAGSLARAGKLVTSHGEIQTPAFVSVGTKGTVKTLTAEQVKACGAQMVLSNTYHLFLEPGEDVVEKARGLGKFMGWNGPTMTDSGGFQVFSLGTGFGKNISKVVITPTHEDGVTFFDEDVLTEHAKLARIDEEGVTFTSHLDGSLHRFTPERSIEIQHKIGADIIVAFDECTSPTADYDYQTEAMERTHRWAERSLRAHQANTKASAKQGLFGVVQGGRHEDLRKESARVISEMSFDGFGIGGSFEKQDMTNAVKWVNEILPEEKPRHLLGIGKPEDLFMGVENGCDLFDCVLPTRLGRHGRIYTPHGMIALLSGDKKYANDFSPVDELGLWDPEGKYTKAYLAHLFRAKESLAGTLASYNNLAFTIHLVDEIRKAIYEDRFLEFKEEFLTKYKSTK